MEVPRSAIMITRSRKLSLKLAYQLYAQTIICRSKWRPFEHIFDRDERLHLFIIARQPRVCTRSDKSILTLQWRGNECSNRSRSSPAATCSRLFSS